MTKRLISFLLALVLLVVVPLSARYRYNPYTKKLDFYEAAGDIVLGDIGDITLTGLATGNILYYNGTAWVNLATGANTNVLTLAGGIPSWAAGGAPAAHAASHEVGGADLVDHDQLTNYLAAQHLTLPNTIVAVLTDHNIGVHTALGLFDASMDVDHDLTTNYVAAQHLVLPSTIAAVLTDHNKAAHDALLIDADTVDGEHAGAIVTNARVKAHFPDTIANILSDHNLLAHTALGLFDASGDVDHDATTNWVANKHIDHTTITLTAAGLITGGGTIDANRTFTLTEATIEAAIDTLVNLTSIQGQVVTFAGSLNVEANSNINQDLTTDSTVANFARLGVGAAPTTNIFTVFGVGTTDGGNVGFPDVVARFRSTTAATHTEISVDALAGYDPVYVLAEDGLAQWDIRNDESDSDQFEIRYQGRVAVNNTFFEITAGGAVKIYDDFYMMGGNVLRIYDIGSSHFVGFTAPALTSNQYWRLPAIDGNANEVWATDGSDDLIWLTHDEIAGYYIYNHVGEDHVTDHNVWIGWLAGQALAVGGQYNTFVGEEAGKDLTTGDNNVAVGYQALFETATGGSNTAVGYQALLGSTGASNFSNNVAIGFQAGFELQSAGINNTFTGYQAGYNEQTGHDLTYYGYRAGYTTNPNGGSSNNTAIGAESGYFLATGASNNAFLGRQSGYGNTNGLGNVALGVAALYDNQEGDYNVAVGYGAGQGAGNNDPAYNVFVGQKAGWAVTTGSYNTFVGTSAGEDITTGTYNIAIGYYAGEGWLDDETYKLIIDVSDTTTPLIYGDFTADNITINGDFNITMDATLDQVVIAQSALGGTEDQALVRITDNREGATVDEKGEAVLSINAYEAWALYVQKGTSQFDDDTIMTSDVFVTWNDVLDKMVISQSSVTGTEDQALIYIEDKRTGVTAQEQSEATIYIDSEGVYALYILDGQTGLQSTYMYAASGMKADDALWSFGAGDDILIKWDLNGAGDDLYTFSTNTSSASATAALFYSEWSLNPTGMTDHDDYLSPSFVIVNWEAADANDYSAVVIGERGQASVLVPHYFDFYAMTGAVDGAVDPNAAELPAIFRFGASGTATPGYSTAGGDVLMEGALEIDGNQQNAGYNRYDYIYWIESFDHGIAANRYSQMWDITSLNVQGNGTNTIDTTPSHITLTTDNNAVGDNEGTITYKQIILRSRLNRSEFSVDLGQTANTQFYCGWNTSQTNAMVAAADEYVIVFFDVSDNANWQIKVGDGATEDVFTSAVAGDTNEIRHEIWVEADGTVHWRVNGTELDITGSVDNLMTANDHYLIVCQAQSVTGAAAIVAEMCYVENEKTKAN